MQLIASDFWLGPPLPTESLRLFHLFKSSAGESLSSVQDTPEVSAARATHLAAHAAVARGKRSVQDTPEVMAATIEHYRAYNAAAAFWHSGSQRNHGLSAR